MNRIRTNRIKDLHRLEARYAQAKRSQVERGATKWIVVAFLPGAVVMYLIHWCVS
jgi:hypothetical protein